MNRNLLSVLFVGFLLFSMNPQLRAQGITTSGFQGTVMTMLSEPIADANIVLVHIPSGTVYGSTTRSDGRFNLPNIRTGGPYRVAITHIGYEPDLTENLTFKLGENKDLLFILIEGGTNLDEVTISARKDFLLDGDRTGTATNLSRQTIDRMPSISRSINDLTKMAPQSNGVSFAGRDNRFNNYTIDGITYNNNFGLGSGQFSGSDPISIDVIEEVQVNIAPFDVREGNFTGANVNAITRSGGNIFNASAYIYYKNERLIGNKIDENVIDVSEAFVKILGARVGGPILKDKVSFFVSIEKEEASNPGLSKVAARDGLVPDGINVSRVTAERLEFVRENIQNLYGYNTGDYEGYKFADEGLRLNARLDYNISNKHKAMIRFNRYTANSDVSVNGNSVRYNPSALRYSNTNRYGIEAMNFRNSHYMVDKNVTSIVGELNSIFNTQMANNFRIGYNTVTDPIRTIPGEEKFPFIEIMEFDGTTPLYYMTLGNELYSIGNQLVNNIFSITDNFSYFMGNHTFTAGVSFESMVFENAYNPVLLGLYRFNSYDNFVSAVIDQDMTVQPDLFLQGYSYKGPGDIPLDETKFGQFAVYIQDKYKFSEKLSITAGLRVDLPFYPIDLPNNP
ncbi:MAG: carboxypeptidase-like regulatory domain-containing protein, partial [Salinivirgaceae bacterium]|nr:carboxypeptidase-like regulatory domain-containing protein [Salinivirgaceae bacterium]